MVSSKNNKMYIEELEIKDFRVIKEVSFKPSKYVNIISGKNGTGKSTILGMIAQGFSYHNNVIPFISGDVKKLNKKDIKGLSENDPKVVQYKKLLTYFGDDFESTSAEHFKLSPNDVRNIEHAEVTLSNKDSFKIESTNHNKKLPRLVTRRKDGKSSNYVHPVIYLGLERLTPLVRSTKMSDLQINLSSQDKKEIHNLYQSILLKKYADNLTATETNLSNKKTASFIDEEMTIEMISSGEDNIGQILLALYSFKKLKNDFPNDYKGGILLIDEIDATLYPAAQNKLLDIILQKARSFDVQIFATSHSLTLLEHCEKLKISNQRTNHDIKLFSSDISSEDNSTTTLSEMEYLIDFKNMLLAQANEQKITESIKIYFEDAEAQYVFEGLIHSLKNSNNHSIKNSLHFMSNTTLSCTNYIHLYKSKVTEFSKNSIVCLDGDVEANINDYRNFITLPTNDLQCNPEEFIFDILDDNNSDYWKTAKNYNHSVFMNNPIYQVIQSIKNGTYESEYKQVNGEFKNIAERKVWKKWFNKEKVHWKYNNNPVKYWAKNNPEKVQEFQVQFEKAFNYVADNVKLPRL